MEFSKEEVNYNVFAYILLFVVFIIILKKLLSLMHTKPKIKDDAKNSFTEEEYKTQIFTQVNTQINSENLENSKYLSNLHHKDIFGMERRSSAKPKKNQRKAQVRKFHSLKIPILTKTTIIMEQRFYTFCSS